jgi:hypothetical protein
MVGVGHLFWGFEKRVAKESEGRVQSQPLSLWPKISTLQNKMYGGKVKINEKQERQMKRRKARKAKLNQIIWGGVDKP